MPSKSRRRIGAAIDIGSNSVHLLVARIEPATPGGSPTVLLDLSELLGLGDVVDAHGHIPADARAQIKDTLTAYSALAAEAGAERLTLLGTESLRRAANASAVAADALDTTGRALHVISVRQEAELSFIGVAGGQLPARPMMVVDIGGGSTQVVLYAPGADLVVTALPIGSARLTTQLVKNDPPSQDDLERLHEAVGAIRRHLPARPLGVGDRLSAVFVGGTSTNLGRLGRLTRTALAEDRRVLHELDSVAITERYGVRPRRARQLAAGAAIVDVLLEHFELEEALVSQASLREGAIIAEWRFGEDWPERLGELFDQPGD